MPPVGAGLSVSLDNFLQAPHLSPTFASSRLVLSDFTLPTISCPAIRNFKAKGTGHVSGYEAVGPPIRAPAALSSTCGLVWDGQAMDHTCQRRNICARGKEPLVLKSGATIIAGYLMRAR